MIMRVPSSFMESRFGRCYPNDVVSRVMTLLMIVMTCGIMLTLL